MHSEYIDHMGTDLSVVNAAKVSFAKSSQFNFNEFSKKQDAQDFASSVGGYVLTPNQDKEYVVKYLADSDKNLINFLARGIPSKEWEKVIKEIAENEDVFLIETVVKTLMSMATHWTPFTHTAISLRMSAPVPIRTQAFKHKIGFTENEESRRYISSTPELFIPEFRLKPEGSIKQGSGGIHPKNDELKEEYTKICNAAIAEYERLLSLDVAPEQARFVLPQGVEVNWVWTGNLAAFARYYNQRSDAHAQVESQYLANEIAKIIEPLFPVSWKALTQ